MAMTQRKVFEAVGGLYWYCAIPQDYSVVFLSGQAAYASSFDSTPSSILPIALYAHRSRHVIYDVASSRPLLSWLWSD